mmetsp:Transcript_10137/g.18642  ORF Transcript_10137/g.18642 Transcript_10137/m.18642 type:complete len:443 (+) Transcript_10137:58-1386(+)
MVRCRCLILFLSLATSASEPYEGVHSNVCGALDSSCMPDQSVSEQEVLLQTRGATVGQTSRHVYFSDGQDLEPKEALAVEPENDENILHGVEGYKAVDEDIFEDDEDFLEDDDDEKGIGKGNGNGIGKGREKGKGKAKGKGRERGTGKSTRSWVQVDASTPTSSHPARKNSENLVKVDHFLLALNKTSAGQSAAAIRPGMFQEAFCSFGSFLDRNWLRLGIFILTAVLVAYLLQIQLSRTIHSEIEKRDRDVIGTDIHIEKVDSNIFTGCINIYGIEVENVKGFTADSILRADKVLVDFDMQCLLLSFFKHIKIEEIALSGVHATVEHTFLNSNIAEMLQFIKRQQEEGNKTDPKDQPDVSIHRIDVKGIRATTRLSTSARITGKRKEVHSTTWPIADILFEDFQTTKGIQPVIKAILSGILQKVKESMSSMATPRCRPCKK